MPAVCTSAASFRPRRRSTAPSPSRTTTGTVPTEDGAVASSLLDLVTYDPGLDPSLYSTHYRAVPGQACARCHLWSRGKGYRGAVGQDGLYRADGCAACHLPLRQRRPVAERRPEHRPRRAGAPHGRTWSPGRSPTDQCLHCHHRGARIGLQLHGPGADAAAPAVRPGSAGHHGRAVQRQLPLHGCGDESPGHPR